MKLQNASLKLPVLLILLLILMAGGILVGVSCSEDSVSYEGCGPRPYTWDEKIGRCKNAEGQVVESRCCGR